MKTSKQLYREKMIIDFGKYNNKEKKTFFSLFMCHPYIDRTTETLRRVVVATFCFTNVK